VDAITILITHDPGRTGSSLSSVRHSKPIGNDSMTNRLQEALSIDAHGRPDLPWGRFERALSQGSRGLSLGLYHPYITKE